jgi:16S rRNA (cytosine967-C5)-methyltransferase
MREQVLICCAWTTQNYFVSRNRKRLAICSKQKLARACAPTPSIVARTLSLTTVFGALRFYRRRRMNDLSRKNIPISYISYANCHRPVVASVLREVWALAIEALCWIELRGLSERLALVRATKTLGLHDPSAMGLAHKLIMETVRRQNFLDHLLNVVLQPESISSFPPNVRAFLRLYAYQTKVVGRDGYEKAAAMARTGRSLLGWRRLAKAEEALGVILGLNPDDAMEDLDDEGKTALRMFQPVWFLRYCIKLLGRRETLLLFESMLASTPTYIRLNTLKTTEETALNRLGGEGVILARVEGLPSAHQVVSTKGPLTRTASFKEGLFCVQDKASCLATEAASPEPGMTVLDVCAAPGAKTTHITQLMDNRGALISVDYSRRRMSIWKRETFRMGARMANPVIADAFNPLPLHELEADLVLLDPPCTSTGAFGRSPSAKWRLSKRSVQGMAHLQWKMLNNCAANVKQGGCLVYSTCSITVEENECLVERFLKLNPDFTLDETRPRIGVPGLRGLSNCQRLYPHIHLCNGFFVAKLTRRG